LDLCGSGSEIRVSGIEFTKVAFRTAIGFVVMGFVGFFVKLIFIPINNIIVGSA
jgi:protein transport protein SEC61 subunit gamma-like protein